MSRGFVKEDDREELPVIPPRAALPAGTPNYVTPKGWEALKAEREEIEQAKKAIPTKDDAQHRREMMVLNGKLGLLQKRLDSAKIIDNTGKNNDQVRFGAIVTYKMLANKITNTFQIVGVDEADIKQNKIGFVAPIAKALVSHKVDEVVTFRLGQEKRKLKILKIEY